jgi:ribonuclease HII
MLRACYHEGMMEAGVDEAGRGCLAGPVVAAAVILPIGYQHAGLNDSKKLSRAQRALMRAEIEQQALAWAVGMATVEEIDTINILQASFLAMHRAIAQLTVVSPAHLLIDGNRFRPVPFLPHTCIVKGDSLYQSIAAASILAKTHRDAWMERLAAEYPAYGWAQNAGYPTRHHRMALRTHGPSPHHRKTFRW